MNDEIKHTILSIICLVVMIAGVWITYDQLGGIVLDYFTADK